MATLQAFCIRDIKMDMFQRPFFMPNRASAIRAFGDAIRNKDTPMAAHPEDYELFHVGQFEEQTAQYESFVPSQISLGGDFK